MPPGKLDRARQLFRDWADALRYVGVTLLFLFVYVMILRPVKKQAIAAFRQLPARSSTTAGGAVGPGAERKPELGKGATAATLPSESADGLRAKLLKQQLSERVKAEPESAGRLVQSWIKEA